jgi:hypothetical protein
MALKMIQKVMFMELAEAIRNQGEENGSCRGHPIQAQVST